MIRPELPLVALLVFTLTGDYTVLSWYSTMIKTQFCPGWALRLSYSIQRLELYFKQKSLIIITHLKRALLAFFLLLFFVCRNSKVSCRQPSTSEQFQAPVSKLTCGLLCTTQNLPSGQLRLHTEGSLFVPLWYPYLLLSRWREDLQNPRQLSWSMLWIMRRKILDFKPFWSFFQKQL